MLTEARTVSENELGVVAIVSLLFKVIMLSKCVLNILELHWKQSFRDKKTKLNICHNILQQLQNRSFQVVERMKTSGTCPKMKNARVKHAKLLFFIVKYGNL